MTDCNKLLELLVPGSPDAAAVRRTLAGLAPRVEAAQMQETAEMLDKLKGLGNSILGAAFCHAPSYQWARERTDGSRCRELWAVDRQLPVCAERPRGLLDEFCAESR